MSFRLALGLVMMLMASASSAAQAPQPPLPGYQGTAEQQKACDAPAKKFCRSAMPDQFRVLQCLQANRAKIGKACRAVLMASGQ